MKGFRLISLFILLFVAVILTSCGEEKDIAATIQGKVYYMVGYLVYYVTPAGDTIEDTVYYRCPAVGAQVYLESDENSDVPYLGPDLYTTTDSGGNYTFETRLGVQYDPVGGGFSYRYVADVAITAFYFDSLFGEASGKITGFTVEAGKVNIAPDLYVTPSE